MAAVQPQMIIESLSQRIAGYQYEKSVPELVLRSFKKDAEKLKDISPAHAYHFLGQIASLEYDADSVIKHYDSALKYANQAILYYNYAVSLTRVGKYRLALSNLKKGFVLLDKEVDLTVGYLHAFCSFLSLSYITKIMSLIEKYRVEMPISIQEIRRFFKQNDINENILEELMTQIRETIYEHNIILSPITQYLNIDNCLNIRFPVDEYHSLEELFECNDKISEIKINLEDQYNIDLGNILISCEVK